MILFYRMSHKRPRKPSSSESDDVDWDDQSESEDLRADSPPVGNWAEYMDEVHPLEFASRSAPDPGAAAAALDRAPSNVPDLVPVPPNTQTLDPTYSSETAKRNILEACGDDENRSCQVCKKTFNQRRRLRGHCANHYTAIVCSCGVTFSDIRDARRHARDHQHDCGELYQVSPDRLDEFKSEIGLTSPPESLPLQPAAPFRRPVVPPPTEPAAPFRRPAPPPSRAEVSRPATSVRPSAAAAMRREDRREQADVLQRAIRRVEAELVRLRAKRRK